MSNLTNLTKIQEAKPFIKGIFRKEVLCPKCARIMILLQKRTNPQKYKCIYCDKHYDLITKKQILELAGGAFSIPIGVKKYISEVTTNPCTTIPIALSGSSGITPPWPSLNASGVAGTGGAPVGVGHTYTPQAGSFIDNNILPVLAKAKVTKLHEKMKRRFEKVDTVIDDFVLVRSILDGKQVLNKDAKIELNRLWKAYKNA